MSDILIKGMKMPKNCGHCPLCEQDTIYDALVYRCLVTDNYLDDGYECQIMRTCPLVPVPQHGRLIEKGVLLYKCYQHFEDFMLGKVDGKTALLNIEKEIKAAPTIIQASGGNEDE